MLICLCAINSYSCHAANFFFNLLNKILKVIDEKDKLYNLKQ